MKQKCQKCGALIKKGDKFCPKCGLVSESGLEQENNISMENINNTVASVSEEQNKVSSKKKIIMIVIIGVVVAVIAVFAIISNSNYNQFVKAYKSEDGDRIEEIYNKMSTVEIEKSRDYLLSEAQGAYDAYMSGKMSFEDADEVLVFIKKSYDSKADKTAVKDFIQKIGDMNDSKTAFIEAEEHYNNLEYTEAYEKYLKVIEEDATNYAVAKARIEELPPLLTEQYYSIAQEKFNAGNNTEALTAIKKAQSFGDSDECKTLRQNIEAAIAIEKEAERQEKLLTPGKKFDFYGTYEATYKGATLTSSIKPEDTRGYYLYYSATSGTILLDIEFEVENISNNAGYLKIVDKLNAKYGTRNYTGFEQYYCYVGGDSIEKIYDYDGLMPLTPVIYHVAVSLPAEAKTSDEKITVTFEMMGQELILEYR